MSEVVVTFKCDKELLRLLDKYAHILKKTRSELIREALRNYLFYLNQTLPLRETTIKVKKVVLK